MNNVESTTLHCWIKRIFVVFLIGILITLIYLILDPFLAPIAWALVLSHTTWPLHLRLKNAIGDRPTLCAFIMVTGTGVLILLPLLWFALIIQDNVVDGYHSLGLYLSSGKNLLPDAILNIPWLGAELQHWIKTHLGDATALNEQLTLWAKQSSTQLVDFFGSVGRNAAKAVFTSITLFVLYRDGERILHKTKVVLCNLLGERVQVYFQTAGETIRAVMFGIVLIATAQGVLAGIGFKLFGVSDVVLLGVLTAIASIIPIVGSFLIWGPVSFWLLINDQPWQAIGLFVWGTLFIGTADNLIRPLMISKAMRVSFLLVMFGIVGGIATFGLIGLFIGPIVLAVALTAWNEWVQDIETASGTT
jgi:predicted PurR-regulated permease PerM